MEFGGYMDFWKTIQLEIFSNDQLDIYEKMCLMVLMSLDEETHLSSVQLANFMGCGLNTAKRAFDSLRIKGYLSKDYIEGRRSSNIIRNEDALEISKPIEDISEEFRAGFYVASDDHPAAAVQSDERVVKPSIATDSKIDQEIERKKQLAAYLLGNDSDGYVSKKVTVQPLVDQVIDLIEEKISFKEANIILAFAGNDIDKIKRKYKIAKQSQVSDAISVLINELQKKETPIIKSEETNTQIDTNRLLKMQAYQNSRLKNDKE